MDTNLWSYKEAKRHSVLDGRMAPRHGFRKPLPEAERIAQQETALRTVADMKARMIANCK